MNKSAHVVLSINLRGGKEVLDMLRAENEGASSPNDESAIKALFLADSARVALRHGLMVNQSHSSFDRYATGDNDPLGSSVLVPAV